MTAPAGWDRRHEPGIVGALARWHGDRRVRAVRAALAARRTPSRDPQDPRGRQISSATTPRRDRP